MGDGKGAAAVAMMAEDGGDGSKAGITLCLFIIWCANASIGLMVHEVIMH